MKQTRLNLGSFHRHHGDNNKPKTHSSNNAEQLVQEKPSTSKRSNIASPTLNNDHHHHHHQEEDNSSLNPNRKQSVITKVKEKAIKWRQTLARKKHASNDNHASAWGVALEDCENDEDPKCLGASMYKSENAPKEEDPWPSRIPALGVDIKSPRPLRTSTNVHRREQFPDHKAKGKPSTSESGKTPNPSPLENHKHTKTLAEAVTEKLAPAYELPTKNRTLPLSKPLTVTPNTSEDDANVVDGDVAFGVYEEAKLEGEGALWEVISKAIGPEMDVGDKGVVEKVKEVVTSLLQAEQEQEDEDEDEKEQIQKQSTQWTVQNTSSTSPLIPISTNAYEGEEESQERILQAN